MQAEYLRSLFFYDPESGCMFRRSTRRRAGSLHRFHGWVLMIDGKSYRQVRLAWLYMTGEDCDGTLKFKNGDRSDLRWANLIRSDGRAKPATLLF